MGKTYPGGDEKKPRLPKGTFGEWDAENAEIEVYNSQGKHQGAWDPETGQQKSGPIYDRKPTYDRKNFVTEYTDVQRVIIQNGFEFPQIGTPPPAAKIAVWGVILTTLAAAFALSGG